MQNASYFRAPRIGGATPRETEIIAFGLCNDRLAKAEGPRARIEALHKNHQLWSLLVDDLTSPGNALPEGLRQQLVAVGTWAMTYSTTAIGRPLPLQPLIEVNANIVEGLRAQAGAPLEDTSWSGAQVTA